MYYRDIQYSIGRQPITAFPAQLVEFLASRYGIRNHYSLADIGCGRGDFTKAWSDLCPATTGYDRDPPLGHIFCKCDILHDTATDCLFDVVFSKSVVEHIPDGRVFAEFAMRSLRPGGRVLMLTPDWRTYSKIFYDDYTHVHPYDVVSAADLLLAAGFINVRSELIYQYAPAWHDPVVRLAADLWRWFVPFDLAMWLHDRTGYGFPKWAKLLTVVAYGEKS